MTASPLEGGSLKGAAWLTAPATQAVLAVLRASGAEARVVGGAVRNTLLGLPVTDIDIATTALPEAILRLATAAGMAVAPTGLAHGTVTVVRDGTPFEVTTLRRDVATDGRHATVAFTDDWAADASRRDFTINALYADADGTLFDPLGGLTDVMARCVRFIGSPDDRIAEDYLRILRFFRFAAQYGHGPLDADGLAACVRGRAGLDQLSAERVRVEVLKLLGAPGVLPALTAMLEHGLLMPVLGAVPRVGRLARVIAIEGQAGLGLAADPVRRLGVLVLHVAEDVPVLVRRLRLWNEEAARLRAMARDDTRRLTAGMPEAEARAALYAKGEQAWRDAVALRWADAGAEADDTTWRALLTLPARWPAPRLPIQGRDLLAMGLPAGPRVGEVLRELEAWWIAHDFPADEGVVRDRARALVGDLLGG